MSKSVKMKPLILLSLLSLLLLAPKLLPAQKDAHDIESKHFKWLGNRIAPSESYFFLETDFMYVPVGFDWFFNYFKGYANLGLGYQHNAWLGFGIHYNGAANGTGRYTGYGLTYRLAYQNFGMRVNIGLVDKLNYRPNSQYCFYDPKLKVNPYAHVWLGVMMFKVLRVGIHVSYIPETIHTESKCWFHNEWHYKVLKVGVGPLILPSIGLSIPLFRSGIPAPTAD